MFICRLVGSAGPPRAPHDAWFHRETRCPERSGSARAAPPGTRTPNPRIESPDPTTVATVRRVPAGVVPAGLRRTAGPSYVGPCRLLVRPRVPIEHRGPVAGCSIDGRGGGAVKHETSGPLVRGLPGHRELDGDAERGAKSAPPPSCPPASPSCRSGRLRTGTSRPRRSSERARLRAGRLVGRLPDTGPRPPRAPEPAVGGSLDVDLPPSDRFGSIDPGRSWIGQLALGSIP